MEPKQTLSEISHLFLSEVRERQTSGTARPTRIPPQRRNDVSVDLTPEEFANAAEAQDAAPIGQPAELPPTPAATPRVSIVLGSHLGDHPAQWARQYARHVASTVGRVGLIEADGSELSICCFEHGAVEPAPPTTIDAMDGRRIAQTLAELSFDVDHWLLFLPNPRTAEARQLLRAAGHWVLLTQADHESIVATYRALKGLSDQGRPRLSLAVLNARDDSTAAAVYRRLAAVSEQFLHCRLEAQPSVRPAPNVTEHLLLQCRSAEAARQPQWQIIADFVAGSNHTEPKVATSTHQHQPPAAVAPEPTPAPVAAENSQPQRLAIAPDTIPQVIDLPDHSADGSVLEAIVRQGAADGQWLACPIKPPMCPESIIAVGRDQRLLLLAEAGAGLRELRRVGAALRWMAENRQLIRMALPQLSIDESATPALRLVVDHADLAADSLQTLVQSQTVTVVAYRKVKWGRKIGLLLEAA
jgi:hypothetical protein